MREKIVVSLARIKTHTGNRLRTKEGSHGIVKLKDWEHRVNKTEIREPSRKHLLNLRKE